MDTARIDHVTTEFTQRFGSSPTLWVRAPGRVDLMGSHTDYNQGFVLTLTIDRDTWIAARPRDDGKVVVQSLDLEGVGEFALDAIEHDEKASWTNYVRGVAVALQEAGYRLAGWDGLVHSTVPLRSGLSSSAALEVATARLFEALGDWRLEGVELARLCQRAENQFVGMNCGILDQYTSALGQEGCALLLDCRNLTSEPSRLHDGVSVVICDTRTRRELTGSEYPERRAQCEEAAACLAQYYPNVTALRDVNFEQFLAHEHDLGPVVGKRCRFIIQENQRVLDLARALPEGDREAIRVLTDTSFSGARELYEIISPEMDAMRAAMLDAPGLIGARQAGAGFGGCMVAFVDLPMVSIFSETVRQSYFATTGIEPRIFSVQASAGAGVFEPQG